jgi:hypothetical protein
LLQRRHESTVIPTVLTGARLNAHDPQFPPLPSLLSSIAVGILPRLLYSTNGNAKAILGTTPIALGVPQQVLVLKPKIHTCVKVSAKHHILHGRVYKCINRLDIRQ